MRWSMGRQDPCGCALPALLDKTGVRWVGIARGGRVGGGGGGGRGADGIYPSPDSVHLTLLPQQTPASQVADCD